MVKQTKQNEPKKSFGYPAIEELIDSEDFSKVNPAFESFYKELDAIAKKKRGLKKGKDAKKAMDSVELVMSLLKELLEIKYQLQAVAKAQVKK